MAEPSSDLKHLREEVAYYQRRIDEVAAENIKLDYAISGFLHELKQKRQGFGLLAQLQQSIGAHQEISAIFEVTIAAINSTLGMDKTVVLTPTEREGWFRTSHWTGFREEVGRRLASLAFEFPEGFARNQVLLANKSSEITPLIEQIRTALDLPYFICLGVTVEQRPIGLLLTGRLKEAKPLYPPLDQGDVDTLQAIAGLISASVQNMRVAVLEEMDRLKTQFFANVSHEFRTPITLTRGPLEQILRGRYGAVPDAIRDQLRVMLQNQDRLLELINQILDLAKLEARRLQLKVAPVRDLNRFVETHTAQFKDLAARRGIAFVFSPDHRVDDADLFLDLEQFERLLVNLLSNALKFTKQGSILVATGIHDDTFRLTVTDTGIGIKEDQLPHIFDRFRQADGGEAREYPGTGIGLALVKEIAELHGGTVTVHSQHGKGSTFTVTFPLGKTHLNPAWIIEKPLREGRGSMNVLAAIESNEGAADPGSVAQANRDAEMHFDQFKETVLYAEDNASLRNYIRDLLAPQYNVFLASDGRDALAKSLQYNPDLIVADVMMPHMSGRDLLRAVRSDARLQSIPVVFLTARAGSEARIESLDAGADDYIPKPFDEGELLARVKNLLRVRAQERELATLNRELEHRVATQVAELERVSRLKRFVSPQLAELIISSGGEQLLESHRREITVVFCDLRGFTAFSESAEPEEVMGILREYHSTMGQVIFQFQGTLERFEGDGLMVFFNDPLPCEYPAAQAVRMAITMRQEVDELVRVWRKRGHELGLGIGIAQGYATLGRVGFEGRFDYAAIGSVTNLAARLCHEAQPGQILVSQRVYGAIEDLVDAARVGEVSLRGFPRPIATYNIVGVKATQV